MSIMDYEAQANRAYILSTLAYLDLALIKNKYGETIIPGTSDFIDKRKNRNSKLRIKDRFINTETLKVDITLDELFSVESIYEGLDERNEFSGIKTFVRNNTDFQSMKVINSSALTSTFSKSTVEAVTVSYEDELYIVFRGTGAGKWLDNGMGGYTTSEMQLAAARYAQEMIKAYGSDKKIYITGHSKGGNLAQAALMFSKDDSNIKKVFSFDGQGFSKESVNDFMKFKNYEALRDKIYQIADKNDFVSPLFMPIVKPENTIFINGIKDDKSLIPHALGSLKNDAGLIAFDKQAEQGPIGVFVKMLSERLIKEDRDTVGRCSLSLMDALEKYLMHYKNKDAKSYHSRGSGFIKKSTKYDLKVLLEKGLPIIKECLQTSEGFAAFEEFKTYANTKMSKLGNSYNAVTKAIEPVAILISALVRSAQEQPLPELEQSETYKLIQYLDKEYKEAIKEYIVVFQDIFKNTQIEVAFEKEQNSVEKLERLKQYVNVFTEQNGASKNETKNSVIEKAIKDVYSR